MSKAMDNIKEELKTLYLDENLTDDELTQMAEKLVQFFELGMKFFLKEEDYYVWKPIKNEKNLKKTRTF